MEYRSEIKFKVSDFDLIRIKNRLYPLMQLDSYQGPNGYSIRSLYFDDIYDSCTAEKENGILYRKKYRIRIYNNQLDYIRLEKKTKYGNMSKKTMQPLSMSDYEALLSGNTDCLHAILFRNKGCLLEEFILKILFEKYSPKCIVEYERFAFTEKTGNVRITFDRNIAGSNQIANFFDSGLFTVPVMPENHHILEIKYDELLPHYILQALDLGCLQRYSFSKYYITRASIGQKEIYYGI